MDMSTSAEKKEGVATLTNWQIGEPIVSYWAGPMPLTSEDVKQMADGGWNLVPVTLRGISPEGDHGAYIVSQLDLLQKYGIRGLLCLNVDFRVDGEKERLGKIISAVQGHPAFYGYNIRDEPGVDMLAALIEQKEFIAERDPRHLVYINLYPIGASSEQLGVGGRALPAYMEYVRRFLKEFRPAILSYDHYHFGSRGDGMKFFLNMALIRQSALSAGLPWMVIVQACSWNAIMRIPTGEELRWLFYTSLAYGALGIAHYVYGYPGHDGGMIYPRGATGTDATGTIEGGPPTPLYFYARELNREFVVIAKELRSLKSLDAFHVGHIPEGTKELPAHAPFRLDPPVPKKVFESIVVDEQEEAALFAEGGWHGPPLEGFLIGYFGKSEKPSHALLVNLDYRTYSGVGQARRNEFYNEMEFAHTTRRALVGPGQLEVFDVFSGQWRPVGSNRFEINIVPGGGILVREGSSISPPSML